MSRVVLVHGGALSKTEYEDGTLAAARRGLDVLRHGESPLEAVVAACIVMEDDARFNAGTGSNLRFDGETVEMDAACTDSDGRFGGVSCLRDVRNPILVARAVLDTPHVLLSGEGAIAFARKLGHKPYDVRTDEARKKFRKLRDQVCQDEHSRSDCEWRVRTLEKAWNYPRPFEEVFASRAEERKGRSGASDTIGAVATDGKRFAAAASTGGTIATLHGRVGDTPLPGCGVEAGPLGAIACTGNGDHLARRKLATKLYRMLEEGLTAEQVKEKAFSMFEDHVDLGVIILTKEGHAAATNREMAWSVAKE